MRCTLKEVTRISLILTLWSCFSLTYGASILQPLEDILGDIAKSPLVTAAKRILPLPNFVIRPPDVHVQSACNSPVPQSSYDYIIIGSGAGGGPLSARLAQAGFSVLLIEAGDDHGDDFVVQIPLLQTQASEYTAQSWEYFVSHYDDPKQAQQDSKFTWRTPQGSFHLGPNPPSGSTPLGIYYPRAATLGGCTEHNALVAMYPHESDWDNIANITGDSSWAASNMRQFWEIVEKPQYLPPGDFNGHGFSGWLNISLTDLNLVANDKQWLSLAQGTIAAVQSSTPNGLPTTASQLGQSFILDLNNDSPTRDTTAGIYQIPLSITSTSKSRSSPRNFILTTASATNSTGKKYRLDIQLNTLATRVTFDKSNPPRATGVEYVTGCNIYRADPASNPNSGLPSPSGFVTANKEVILSAGAFNTPQLLKLSGIGPREELAAHRIPLVLDAPAVGTNMQDRYEVTVTASAPTNFSSLANCTFLHNPVTNGEMPTADPCFNTWNSSSNQGIYGTNAVAFGIVNSSSVAASTEADLFVAGLPFDFRGYFPGYSTQSDLKHWAWLVLKAHTRNNAGTVTLRSSNPLDMPLINFRSFSDADSDLDVTAVAEGVKIARRLFSNVPASSNMTFQEELPGPGISDDSDDLKTWIKQEAWGHHASCTVPIGKLGDQNAVLDSNFKVQGIDGLRVVDASVFPKIPGFYIAGAIYMISEKAASVIIADATPS